MGGIFGGSKYIHGLHHEETDDAQIDANISPVIPRISGYVTQVMVKDNQKVKKGDTLIFTERRLSPHPGDTDSLCIVKL